MINKHDFMDEIMTMETIDTHTHLIGDRLGARDFWEIADYFWLFRELQAAGYPPNVKELPEKERVEAFLKAYYLTRNTMMNQAFTKIMKDLYNIEITDAHSVFDANQAILESSRNLKWPQQVADRLNIRRFAVNYPEHTRFAGMDHDALLFPRIDGRLNEWTKTILSEDNRKATLDRVKQEISELLEEYHRVGCPGVMSTLPRYKANAKETYQVEHATKDQVMMILLHFICSQLEKHGMFMQFFLGVEYSWSNHSAAPVNDPERIIKLYRLFEQYSITFELVVASELNNLDVVQAAWNFPNVHVGGMWWYNFRPSTYLQSMRYRIEALPAIKNSIIVSDARCIEWTYGKIILVKRLLAQFLLNQIEAGWIDREIALQVAKGWLHDSASLRYGLE